MYVKIYNEKDGSHEMYECESYRVFPVFEEIPERGVLDEAHRTMEFSDGIAIDMIRDGQSYCVVKDKPAHIYVMNERGKTIDSYDLYQEDGSPIAPAIAAVYEN